MDSEKRSEVRQVLDQYIRNAREELASFVSSWMRIASEDEKHEVIGGLTARQVSLTTQLANSPLTWNCHSAPLFLRAMIDVHITLAWILKDPLDRTRKFILYGLGQEKLLLEHLKRRIEESGEEPDEDDYVTSWEEELNEQRFTFLTEVNLGSWSGLSTRAMAEEAGCIDLYNYEYSLYSSGAHSMWQIVRNNNLRRCANHLHRYHRVPHDPSFGFDFMYLRLAASYLDETLELVTSSVHIDRLEVNALDTLDLELERLGIITYSTNDAEEPGSS